jgi:hypothetical protein
MSKYEIFGRTLGNVRPDDLQLERLHGCNGINHVDQLRWVKLRGGKVIDAEPVLYEQRGFCNRSCKREPEYFTYIQEFVGEEV